MQREYRQPVVIHFGNGKLAQLSDEIDALGGARPARHLGGLRETPRRVRNRRRL